MYQVITTFSLVFLCLCISAAAQKGEGIAAIAAVDRPDEEWWPARHQEKLKVIAGSKDFQLVFIGDSIVHGWEDTGQKFWQKFYEHRRALNLGYSGDRTEHALWRLRHGELEGLAPQLVVLMIGTNNTGHRQDPADETALGIKAILEELKQRLPESKVLLLGVFPRGETPNDALRKLNVATNAIIASQAEDPQITYLDISEAFLDDNGHLPADVMPDFLHPNERGYQVWAEAMEATVARLLEGD